MTDPTGLSFLSYRRTRPDDARTLIALQHDLGIPTWQDLTDLGQGHTDAQLREVLTDPKIANAVAYLTPDVKDSPTITRTELPGILKRTEADDGFFLLPVAAGGLKYDKIAETVGTYSGTHDVGQWNVTKIDSDPLSTADGITIAMRVLKHRLLMIHAAHPPGAPLKLALHTRAAPAFVPGTALSLDWTHRFAGRQASDADWQTYLLPALAAVGAALPRFVPGRPLLWGGLCALPAAVALGATFLATRGIQAAWQQPSPQRQSQDWSLAAARAPSGCQIDLRPADTAADDIAVLVSVTSNVEPAFAASRPDLSKFRAILQIKASASYPHDLENPNQARDVAALVVEGLRLARDNFQARGALHLFLAVPVGLAFLIGQSLNTAGPVQTYEHLPSDAVGRYHPAVLLHPGA
jgi:hypothetical protein